MPSKNKPNIAAPIPFDRVHDMARGPIVLSDDFLTGDLVGDDTAVGLGALGWVVTDVAGSANSDVALVAATAASGAIVARAVSLTASSPDPSRASTALALIVSTPP